MIRGVQPIAARGFGLATPKPRRQAEPVVAMINVVFLLLIFFLMSAEIAPPDPFDVTLPEAPEGTQLETGAALFLSAAGEIAFGPLRGDIAVSAAVAAWQEAEAQGLAQPLTLRADASADGASLAGLLAELAGKAPVDVVLVTQGVAR